ncbi:hypothetical protein AAG570_009741 [Ranatra chinensis]|uniref:Uncharacterized protein n=1 Tax=Ranatra chinensis TaxID=642074 RepID=A0ABD0YPZ7_9HEMI
MKEGWRWEEHWKRWYRRTTETVLPLLAEARLLVDNCSTLHRLLNLNMNFTTPLNNLLLRLFTPQQEGQLTVHWLGMVSTIMLSLCTYKEERILLELEQLNLYVREEGDDPLNVKTVSKTLPPQSLMAKLILRVVKTSVMTLKNRQENILENEKCGSLEKLLANFILCNIHISQPGKVQEKFNIIKKLI